MGRQEQDVVEGQRRRAELGLVSHAPSGRESGDSDSLLRAAVTSRVRSDGGVSDAEMMADLVHHGAPDLVDHLVLGLADGADRQAVDGDPVRQHPA